MSEETTGEIDERDQKLVDQARKTFSFKRLNARHHLIFDLTIAGENISNIARMLDMTPANVSTIVNSPHGQAELSRRRADIEKGTSAIVEATKRLIQESSLAASSTMVELLNSDDETVRFRSAKDILDRTLGETGGKDKPVTVVNADKLQILISTMSEMGQSFSPQTPVLGKTE